MTLEMPGDAADRLSAARGTVLRRVRRQRRTTNGLVAAALVIAAGCGAGATLLVQQVPGYERANAVRCYLHDDLGSFHGDAVQAVAAASDGRSAVPQPPADKRAMCELVWKSGLAVQAAGGHPKVDPGAGIGDYAVPPLALCRLPDGTTGGFPVEAPSTTAAQVCDRLGLPRDPAR